VCGLQQAECTSQNQHTTTQWPDRAVGMGSAEDQTLGAGSDMDEEDSCDAGGSSNQEDNTYFLGEVGVDVCWPFLVELPTLHTKRWTEQTW
jgi:hypothetical protein